MDANFSIRNESLQEIVVTMNDDDRKRTCTIPPNGEVAFKAHALDRPEFQVHEANGKDGEKLRLLTSKTAGPLESLAASAVSITYVFDGAKLH